MPVPLFQIPEHVRDSVIQKMRFFDFVNFHQSSRDAFDASMKVKTRFTVGNEKPRWDLHVDSAIRIHFCFKNGTIGLNFSNSRLPAPIGRRKDLDKFPLRIDCGQAFIWGTFTDEFCHSLTNLLERTGSVIDTINFYEGKFECSSEALSRLVGTKKIKKLMFPELISPEFMDREAIKNISSFNIHDFIDDTDLLSLNVADLKARNTNVTSSGINSLLKELLSGKKTINQYTLYTNQRLRNKIILEGIRYSFLRALPGDQKSLRQFFEIGEGKCKYDLVLNGNNITISIISV